MVTPGDTDSGVFRWFIFGLCADRGSMPSGRLRALETITEANLPTPGGRLAAVSCDAPD
jgi:hypothetical protein